MRFSRQSCRWQSHADQKGDDPKTDHTKGTTRTPGWQPEETEALTAKAGYECLNNATVARRPDAVGWAPLVGRPADYLPSGTVGQWLPAPCNGGPCKRGGDPRTDQVKKGDDSDPGLATLRDKRPNCHFRRKGTLEPAWVLHQGEGPQRPHSAKGRGPKDPSVVAPLHTCAESRPCSRDGTWGSSRHRQHHCFLAQRRHHARN